jgi:phage-related protein
MDELRPVIWVGTSKKELKSFPQVVRRDIGQALYTAQAGGVDPAARPLKGFKGAKVIEIVSLYRTDTFRMVYTVKLGEVVFVLHAFQKKSKTGIKTPRQDINLIYQRLAQAMKIWRDMNQ